METENTPKAMSLEEITLPAIIEQPETTMKAKHTPGPWEWIKNPSDPNKYALELVAPDTSDDSILYHGADWPINEANAKLIAAAPDLLEALTLLMGRLEFHGSIDPIREEGPIQDAINAIRKATL